MSDFFDYKPKKESESDMKLESCLGHYHLIFTRCGHSIVLPRVLINEFDAEFEILAHLKKLNTMCLECNIEFEEMERRLSIEIAATLRNGGLK